MARVDKLAIAVQAIKDLPPLVRASGVYSAASATRPEFWHLEVGAWALSLTERVLLSPIDPALSSLLDVWASAGGKVFSASWMPDRPWVPPRVVQCKPGHWQDIGRNDLLDLGTGDWRTGRLRPTKVN